MIWVILFIIGGFFNFYKFNEKVKNKDKSDLPYAEQGYVIAFIMGGIFYGTGMYLIYYIFS